MEAVRARAARRSPGAEVVAHMIGVKPPDGVRAMLDKVLGRSAAPDATE